MSRAIKYTLSDNLFILQSLTIDRRHRSPSIEAFKAGFHQRVQVLIFAEYYQRSLLSMKVDVALQHDRSRLPDSSWNDHTSPALLIYMLNSLSNGVSIERIPIRDGPKLFNTDRVIRKFRHRDFRHIKRQAFVEKCRNWFKIVLFLQLLNR